MIGYQGVISDQGEEGPGPLRLTLTPGFLPTCLSCPRGEKRFLAGALLLHPPELLMAAAALMFAAAAEAVAAAAAAVAAGQ